MFRRALPLLAPLSDKGAFLLKLVLGPCPTQAQPISACASHASGYYIDAPTEFDVRLCLAARLPCQAALREMQVFATWAPGALGTTDTGRVVRRALSSGPASQIGYAVYAPISHLEPCSFGFLL